MPAKPIVAMGRLCLAPTIKLGVRATVTGKLRLVD